MLAQLAHRVPAEGADAHHDHDRHQRRHRNLPHPGPRKTTRISSSTPATGVDRRPSARLHVDDRLTDHRAARHAANESRGKVGHALAHAFAVLVARGVGQFVHDGRRHHGFEQAHHRQRGRVGTARSTGFPA